MTRTNDAVAWRPVLSDLGGLAGCSELTADVGGYLGCRKDVLAPLFYGALGCLGLFFGARRWLGRYGGAAAVGLFCSSGAALLLAWCDYMPTFTGASLIAAGTGALLWAVLAAGATARRRTCAGLAGFVAVEAAVFVRYTDIVVLGCGCGGPMVSRPRLPAAASRWSYCWPRRGSACGGVSYSSLQEAPTMY